MPSDETPPQHLSAISTQWSLIFDAHKAEGDTATRAQTALMQRYCGAVYRYVLAVLRDAHAAEELTQDFALHFVRGDFKHADAERGRFRDYVKTSVYHLLVNHLRTAQAQPRPLPADSALLPIVEPQVLKSENEFVNRWREELLERVWESLEAFEKQAGVLYYTVLRWRAENTVAQASELAELLSRQMKKPFTDAGIRQTLHRARERFADMLLDEVARSLETTCPEKVEQELMDLNLLGYCGPALDRWKTKHAMQ
jgi:RNA polymerase sigma-70 factor (ECF subfamily)